MHSNGENRRDPHSTRRRNKNYGKWEQLNGNNTETVSSAMFALDNIKGKCVIQNDKRKDIFISISSRNHVFIYQSAKALKPVTGDMKNMGLVMVAPVKG